MDVQRFQAYKASFASLKPMALLPQIELDIPTGILPSW
jgi:hypothetical protein